MFIKYAAAIIIFSRNDGHTLLEVFAKPYWRCCWFIVTIKHAPFCGTLLPNPKGVGLSVLYF